MVLTWVAFEIVGSGFPRLCTNALGANEAPFPTASTRLSRAKSSRRAREEFVVWTRMAAAEVMIHELTKLSQLASQRTQKGEF
jgi:hypothetical protein